MDKPMYLITDKEIFEKLRIIVREELKSLQPAAPVSDSEEPFIQLPEVKQLFSVSRSTIFNWIRDKKIPCHRLGSRLFFKKSELISAMQSNGDRDGAK
jgi:excisionase family DNA binding protein